MATFGVIHMDCYCGAELLYIGDSANGEPPSNIIEKLKTKVASEDVGYFSSADGSHGDCPFCGLTYELPDPEVMDWLPYLDRDRFSSIISDIKNSTSGKNGKQLMPPTTHRYLL